MKKLLLVAIGGAALLALVGRSKAAPTSPSDNVMTGDAVTQQILPTLQEQGVINPKAAVDLWAVEKLIRNDFTPLQIYGVQNIIQGDPNQFFPEGTLEATTHILPNITDPTIQNVIRQIRMIIGTWDKVQDASIPISLSEAYAYYDVRGGL